MRKHLPLKAKGMASKPGERPARRGDVPSSVTTAPIASFTAKHEGVSKKECTTMSEDLFSGLPYELELCEGAPILATSNVWVSAGLMNGTRGTIRAIVYRKGDRPDHDDPQRRLPHVILAECPKYSGQSFFDVELHPERRYWVHFFRGRFPSKMIRQFGGRNIH